MLIHYLVLAYVTLILETVLNNIRNLLWRIKVGEPFRNQPNDNIGWSYLRSKEHHN
jgi:hypothetical protein